jgi:hypothetical protein
MRGPEPTRSIAESLGQLRHASPRLRNQRKVSKMSSEFTASLSCIQYSR